MLAISQTRRIAVFPSTVRQLTDEEIFYVSGGDDDGGSCAAGDCGSAGVGDDGVAGTLSEVTVTATQDNGIGDTQAEALVGQINTAFTDPVAALFMFFSLIGNSSFPSLNFESIPVNPMGDPSPLGP